MLQGLEGADGLAKLLSFHHVRQGDVVSALRSADHLGGNTDTTLVQGVDGVLVAMANLTQHVLLGNLHIVKVQDASR